MVVERKREREESSKESSRRPTKRTRERIVIPTRIRRGVKRTLSQPSYPEKKRQIVCESEVNYDEVLNEKTEKEISKEEMTSRENNVVTGFEIVPYRGGSVFSPCKSIVPYEFKSDLMNFLNNHHTVLPFKANALVVPPPPIVPSNKYLRTLNESTVKIEEVPMDLHSEESMDADSYSMDID